MRYTPFLASHLRTAIALRDQGKSLTAIAKAIGRSRNGVKYHLQKAGVPLPVRAYRPPVEVDMARARQVLAECASIKEAARRLGVSFGTLHRRLSA